MASLPDSLRRRLENTVVKARDKAEDGARAAFKRLAVGDVEPPDMAPEETELRRKLRAHAKQLGDLEHLVSECAYEHWHQMLFARFLAENQLLIHSDHDVPVTLAECEELATEAGVEDGWTLAARFAARMLPEIFRPNDPVLSVPLAPEHLQPLEKHLADLPVEIFTADDGLGWVYQFWQSKRKKAVNESGAKIGADELPVVTQLFTEPYMVQFLLHNTLGAWWAGKVLARQPELAVTASDEEELRAACSLPGFAWSYLRFIRMEDGDQWRPAAGTFDGWPERAAEITVLDPCCGSGHFLVEAFRILVSLRRAEEDLSAREACAAVLRDNLFGLEIDERCTQIAAFNLALSAWTYPEAGGYRTLPELHIACSGLSVGAKEEEWLRLAGKDDRLRQGIRRLYHLFKDAPVLGSLIDPHRELEPQQRRLGEVTFEELRPLLDQALGREDVKHDAQATEVGIAAQGMAKAATMLASSYALVITNVPYLGRGKQDKTLRDHLKDRYEKEKADLATTFMKRCVGLCANSCSAALVTPQNWWFLSSYKEFRVALLSEETIHCLVALGEEAWQSFGDRGPVASMLVASKQPPTNILRIFAVDALPHKTIVAKINELLSSVPILLGQKTLLSNPDARLALVSIDSRNLLELRCDSWQGLVTTDSPRFVLLFWESSREGWEYYISSPTKTRMYGGRESKIAWMAARGPLHLEGKAHNFPPKSVLGKPGILVSQVRSLSVTLYSGEIFAHGSAPVIPRDPRMIAALWCFLSSKDYQAAVRNVDKKLAVTNGSLVKVEFDAERWHGVAQERYPNGLPEPESDDPTQWLFHGRPEASTAPLPVAVARLLGYRWPAELDETIHLSSRAKELVKSCAQLQDLVDADGIVCIPPVRGEQSAAERLQRLLAQAFGAAWTPATLPSLLKQAEFSGKPLDDWLRDGFFEQHCQLFQQRPFIWHIWDGRRRDGFAALVNYHKLDRKLLERLTYTVLGDWITHQRQGAKAGELGAEDRLAAAETLQRKLALILEGEPPYDIFVRWKPLDAQPIGWDPDLNDGVRMNIRPFVEAGVLRKNPRIKWTKDRGAEPQSLRPKEKFPWFWKDGEFTGERMNYVPLTNTEKRAARVAGGK